MRTTRYSYEAKDPQGGLHQGYLEASTRAHAKSLLAQQNLEPVSLKIDRHHQSEAAQLLEAAEKSQPPPKVLARSRPIRLVRLRRFLYSPASLWRKEVLATRQEKAIFLNELSLFLDSGIDLARAIRFLAEPEPHQSNEPLRQALENLGEELSLAGTAVPDAMDKTGLFTPLEIARIRAAEKGGKLARCFVRIAGDLQEQMRITRSLRTQMATPGAVLAMTWILLPLLISVAAKTSASLGSANGLLNFLAHPASLVVLFAVLPLVIAQLGRHVVRTNAHRLPLLGELYYQWQICFSARALAELLDSGVSLTEALPLAGSVACSQNYGQALCSIAERGTSLAEAVEPFYPSLLLQMLRAGETTGQVPPLLLRGVHMLEEDCRYRVETMVHFLEPVLMLIVGVLVGLVCLLSLQPLFGVLGNL